MMELLRLSDSRAALAGGLAADTVCMGTLVVFLLQPSMLNAGHSGSVLLLSLGITVPILASSAVILSLVLEKRFDVEERARRAMMAAAVLHGGVQLSAVIGVLCGNGPVNVHSYFLTTWLTTTLLAVSFVPLTWMVRALRKQFARKISPRPEPELPPAKL